MTVTAPVSKSSVLKIVGLRIRDFRTKKGYSQEELAQRASITQEKISRYELGTTSPSIATLEKIATGLDVKIEELLKE